MKYQYKLLLDYSPLNDESLDTIPYATFGLKSGALNEVGEIHLFDGYPEDAYLKWGKIGYYRLGMTTLEEAKVQFRSPCTGFFEAEGSLDGKSVECDIYWVSAYENCLEHTMYPSLSARWFNLTVRGYFDVSNLEFRGYKAGRR